MKSHHRQQARHVAVVTALVSLSVAGSGCASLVSAIRGPDVSRRQAYDTPQVRSASEADVARAMYDSATAETTGRLRRATGEDDDRRFAVPDRLRPDVTADPDAPPDTTAAPTSVSGVDTPSVPEAGAGAHAETNPLPGRRGRGSDAGLDVEARRDPAAGGDGTEDDDDRGGFNLGLGFIGGPSHSGTGDFDTEEVIIDGCDASVDLDCGPLPTTYGSTIILGGRRSWPLNRGFSIGFRVEGRLSFQGIDLPDGGMLFTSQTAASFVAGYRFGALRASVGVGGGSTWIGGFAYVGSDSSYSIRSSPALFPVYVSSLGLTWIRRDAPDLAARLVTGSSAVARQIGLDLVLEF